MCLVVGQGLRDQMDVLDRHLLRERERVFVRERARERQREREREREGVRAVHPLLLWVVRVGGDDGELRPCHYIYVYSIESNNLFFIALDSNRNLIAGSIHNEYDFGVSKDGYKTIVYLKFIYTLKIDQNLRQNCI